MISKRINLSECKEGDILADDALNTKGVNIAATETILNKYIMDKLAANGIESLKVYINNDLAEDNDIYDEMSESYHNNVTNVRELFKILLNGKHINYNYVLSISNDIYNYKKLGYRILKCLNEIKNKDEYTYQHSVNVALYSMFISKWLNLNDNIIEKAIQSGLLHDLGKAKIPHDILNKKGILTKEEFEIIRNHTLLGYEMTENINGIDKDVKQAILLHHERMDGSGYPYHRKSDSEDFNLYAKIVAIADVFDAMTSDRVYKKKTTPFEVFEMFQTIGFTMFDIHIAKVFMERIAVYLIGSKVLLNSGEIGEIVYIPLHNLTCPVIKVSSGYLDLSQYETIKISNML